MKKLIYLILLCVIVFSTACDDFLEEVPKSSISPANFYKTQDDALAAVNAAYSALQPDGYYGRYWITSSVHAGDGDYTRLGTGSDRADIILMRDAAMLTSDRYNIQIWNAIWKAVNNANAVLDNVPDIDMDETLKARIIGEAKFLRALNYFNMVRRWGGVPIVLHETSTSVLADLQIPKNSAEQVYAQIEQDLTDAIGTLPNLGTYTGNKIGRASKEAAQGLLAKVQLYEKKWPEAKTNAVAVVNNSSGIDLMPDPKDNWWESSNRDNNKESIFEVQYDGVAPNNHALGNNFEPNNNGWGPGQWGSIHANFHFYNKFSNTDKRKAASFLTEYPNKTTGVTVQWWQFTYPSPHVAKFRDPSSTTSDTYDIKILRFADVLLVAAEACNESGDATNAYQYVNRVRARAGLNPLAGLSKEQLRDSIYSEFRKELCYEGQDYEELVRTGRFISEKTASCTYTVPTMYNNDGSIRILDPNNAADKVILDKIPRYQPDITFFELDEHNKVFPFPQIAIDKNPNLVQNPGY